MRRQALAAAGIEDKTPYVVTHGEGKLADKSLYFSSMQVQIRTLKRLLDISNKTDIQWRDVTQEFPELDEIVDLTSESENLSPSDMRSQLIRLYQTYVSEWERVESKFSIGLFDRALCDNQPVCQRSSTVIPKS